MPHVDCDQENLRPVYEERDNCDFLMKRERTSCWGRGDMEGRELLRHVEH